MINTQKEAILIAFLNEKARYKKLAEYIVNLIQGDPSSPRDSIHTIIYRIKDEFRLVEKIDMLNRELLPQESPITENNYTTRIGDLLGVRIIGLRLSDIEKIEVYLGLLVEEKFLRFIKRPDQKKSFILPMNPGESLPNGINLTCSGYSSVHYQAALGENSDTPLGLANLQFEFQLRTILEEAWGEIDHKYRYMYSRTGIEFPEHIHAGFYHFSAYLQVAALQAESLCSMAEAYKPKKNVHIKKKAAVPSVNEASLMDTLMTEGCQKASFSSLEMHLETILGFKVTARTMAYIERRLDEINLTEERDKTLQKVFTHTRVLEFSAIFSEILDCNPFTNEKERNIDVINALNFAIFKKTQGERVAREGLISVLIWRKERSSFQLPK